MSVDDKKLENEKSLWITAIGISGFIIVFLVGGPLADSHSDYAPTVLWFGLVLFIYYIFLFIGNTRFVKTMAGEWGSKVAFSVLIAVILLESNRQAAIEINAVFGLSASVFSGTQYVMTLLKTFILSKSLLGVFAIWGGVSFIYYLVTGGSGTHRSIQTFIFAISGIVIGIIGLLLIETKLNNETLHKKIYLVAHSFDFNSNVKCSDQVIKGSGIFLGPSQNRVLVDESSTPDMGWLQAVYASPKDLESTELPKKEQLKIYSCT